MTHYSTGQFDNARTGWNSSEKTLTVAAVKAGFVRLFQHALDSTVYAQPLYVPNVSVARKGKHNVVVVATEANSVHLIDADKSQPVLQSRSLVPAGERTVLWSDLGDGRTPPFHTFGVTGTPVIDVPAKTIYVVAKTIETTGAQRFHHRLYALDLGSLSVKPGSPVDITPSFPPNLKFDSHMQLQRPALLLSRGRIYIAFGSHADAISAQGWIVAYDATTLAQTASFTTTTHQDGLANIWQSGCGLAADADGSIYCATGNGLFSAFQGGHDYGNTVLKLKEDLTVVDSLTPCNQCHLSADDADLGSGGVLVLPDQPGPFPRLLLAGGKEGTVYLLNRDNLGTFNDPKDPSCQGDTTTQYCSDNVVQRLWRVVGGNPRNTHARDAIFGGPAYYAGPTGTFIYYIGEGDSLRAFSLKNSQILPTSVMQSSDVFVRPSNDNGGGSTPVVSSDSAKPGTGIVWAIVRAAEGGELALRAYDATDLTNKLVDQDCGPWLIPGTPFLIPTVANGKVYVATTGMLSVFGLDPCQAEQDKVTALKNQLSSLQDALTSGKLPVPPRTPPAVARVEAEIAKLRRKLIAAEKALNDCRASHE